MSYYFDAFRIDHILGFFRIWSVPIDSVEGIMGHFVPALPVHVSEFHERGIWFDHHRYAVPFITDAVLWDIFGELHQFVKEEFLAEGGYGQFALKDAFNTQRKVEQFLPALSTTITTCVSNKGCMILFPMLFFRTGRLRRHTVPFPHLDGAHLLLPPARLARAAAAERPVRKLFYYRRMSSGARKPCISSLP